MQVEEDRHDVHNLLILLMAEFGPAQLRGRVEDVALEEGLAHGLQLGKACLLDFDFLRHFHAFENELANAAQDGFHANIAVELRILLLAGI